MMKVALFKAVTLTALVLSGSHLYAAGAPPATAVTVKTVAEKDVAVQYEYVGRVSGSREVEIRARVTGIVEKRLYKEGSKVKAGQVLFQLETASFEAQLAVAKAELARAKAQLKQARREYNRMLPLIKKKLASQVQLDEADSGRDLANAAVKLAQAYLKSAQINLEYTQVVAPIAGVTGRAEKMEGALVQAGSESLLTTLAQLDPVYVDFGIAEREQQQIKMDKATGSLVLPEGGFEVALLNTQGDSLDHSGVLNFQDYKVSARTGSFSMRATIPNEDDLLAPGQFVRVQLKGATRVNAIVVPQRSVLDGPKGKYVYVVASNDKDMKIAEQRPVSVGDWVKLANETDSNAWVIRDGLQAGDQVVVNGMARIFFPGMPINPTEVGAETGSETAPAEASATDH